MNTQQTVIQWDIATHEAAQRQTRGQQQRSMKMEEFLQSNCDLFSSNDFYYYSGETGEPVEKLIKIARFETNIASLMENAAIDNDWELIELFTNNLI